MKKTLISLATGTLLIVLSVMFIGRYFYPDNVAETSPEGGEKQLRTRVYKADPETVRQTVRETIPELSTWGSAWKLTGDGETEEDGREVRAEVPVLVFTDDLSVTIREADEKGRTRVDVRSASRVGKSDFGENARHVRKLLAALDERLGEG